MPLEEAGRRVLAFVGPRAAGKSTVALRLAGRFGCEAVDLDAATRSLAAEEGVVRDSAGALLAAEGLERFREWEARALAALTSRAAPCVLATGGGAVEREDNRDRLRAHALCVWLDATPERLADRIAAADALRPPLTELPLLDEVRELRRRREPLYAELAALRIDTSSMTLDEVIATLDERVVFDRRRGSVFRTKGGA